MDTLSLRWVSGEAGRPTKTKRKKQASCAIPPALGVFVNDEPLDKLLSKAAAKHGSKGLGDVFIPRNLIPVIEPQRPWLASMDEAISITLLVCGCGHWGCSCISVDSTCKDNWVHWRFDLNPVYREHYGELPEFWFERKSYNDVVANFTFNSV